MNQSVIFKFALRLQIAFVLGVFLTASPFAQKTVRSSSQTKEANLSGQENPNRSRLKF